MPAVSSRSVVLAALLALVPTACGDDPDPRTDAGSARDARALPEAAPPDAGDGDAGDAGDAGAEECAMSKFRTSGLAQPFGEGASCDFLVVCASSPITGALRDAILGAFPEADCPSMPDYTCRASDVASCITHVADLDPDEVDAGCAISRFPEVTGMVCAGDL